MRIFPTVNANAPLQCIRWLTITSIFFIPLSPSLDNLHIIAAIIALFSSNALAKLKLTLKNPANFAALCLLLALFFGMWHNPMGLAAGYKGFSKYAFRMISMLILLPFFQSQKWRTRAINAFLFGCCVSLMIYLSSYYEVIGWSWLYPKSTLFSQHFPPIPYSIILAITGFICLHRITSQNKLIVHITLLIILLYALFFVNIERTGMILFIVLSLLYLQQRLKGKYLFWGFALFCLLILLVHQLSPVVNKRLNETARNVMTSSAQGLPRNSVALRIRFTQYSLRLIGQKPLMGYGSGTFFNGYSTDQEFGPDMDNYTINPENAFLHFALQVGIPGALLYSAWLFLNLLHMKHLAREEKWIFSGIIIAMGIASLLVTILSINMTATLLSTFLAIFGSQSSPSPSASLDKPKQQT